MSVLGFTLEKTEHFSTQQPLYHRAYHCDSIQTSLTGVRSVIILTQSVDALSDQPHGFHVTLG